MFADYTVRQRKDRYLASTRVTVHLIFTPSVGPTMALFDRKALLLLALLGLCVAVNGMSFYALSQSTLSGTSSVRASSVSYKYDSAAGTKACLDTVQLRQCRVTGCVECSDGIPTGGYFQ